MNQILVRNNCFLIHCLAKSSNNGYDFYERLHAVINNRIDTPLSTSILCLGDVPEQNLYTLIGVIVESSNILYSSPQYREETWGSIGYFESGIKNPTEDDIQNAISNRTRFTEFKVPANEYNVKGFLYFPNHLAQKQFYESDRKLISELSVYDELPVHEYRFRYMELMEANSDRSGFSPTGKHILPADIYK